jgi:hypothetical protein
VVKDKINLIKKELEGMLTFFGAKHAYCNPLKLGKVLAFVDASKPGERKLCPAYSEKGSNDGYFGT